MLVCGTTVAVDELDGLLLLLDVSIGISEVVVGTTLGVDELLLISDTLGVIGSELDVDGIFDVVDGIPIEVVDEGTSI